MVWTSSFLSSETSCSAIDGTLVLGLVPTGRSRSKPDLVVLVGVVIGVAVVGVDVVVVTAVDWIRPNVSFHLYRTGVETMVWVVGDPLGWGTARGGHVVSEEVGNGVDVSIPATCAL